MPPRSIFQIQRTGSNGGIFEVEEYTFGGAAAAAVAKYGWTEGEIVVKTRFAIEVYRITDGQVTQMTEKSSS